MPKKSSEKDLGKKYSERINEQFQGPTSTASYQDFQEEESEQFRLRTMYERYCAFAEKNLSFAKLSEKSQKKLGENIEISGLRVTPNSVFAATLLTIFIGLMFAIPFYLFGMLQLTGGSKNFAFFTIATSAFIANIVYSYPSYSSQITKIRAQQESLLAILYMTIYMKVNPVLENAVFFAIQHLDGPLGRDLKRVLWMVDSEKEPTIEKATNIFIPLWSKRNPDFVKSFLTLHSVLKQFNEESQARILNKSLDNILDSTYEKMKHFSHELQMPVMILQTFGLMLPLIGLIAFPMISTFMADSINISYVFFGYVIVLPALTFFFINRIIAKRPGAFSVPDISNNPFLPPEGKYTFKIAGKQYLLPVLKVALIVGFIIMIPGLFHLATSTFPAYQQGKQMADGDIIPDGSALAAEYTPQSMLLTLSIPAGLAVGLIIFFYFSSIQKLKLRDQIIEIEDDLGDSLFTLSNQFTEKIPLEQAIVNFIEDYEHLNLKKRSIFFFFSEVISKMRATGLTFSQAIFDSRYGIIIKYPSVLLTEIAWILVEGSRKGSEVLYNVTTKISIYLGSVKKIKELLYDLLAETVTSINVQAKFLAPFIAAIVGSLTFVIVRALWLMSLRLQEIIDNLQLGGAAGTDNFLAGIVNFAKITPPTIFVTIVGIYMVQTVVLLSLLANGVENGFDKVKRDITIAKNLFYAIIIFLIVSIVGVLVLYQLVQDLQSVGGDIIRS